MAVFFGVMILAVLVLVVVRIREHRLRRYGLLIVALALMSLQLFGLNRDDPRVNAVERIHFLFYGGIAYLYFAAFRRRGVLNAVLLAFGASLIVAVMDESVQWFFANRTGEVMDVLLNAYATVVGLLVSLAFDVRGAQGSARPKLELRLMGRMLACDLVLVAAFIHFAHLGYSLEDEGIGRFRSYFTLEQLEEIGEARLRSWAEEKPWPERSLDREDQYRREAERRVQHRNASFERGDFYQAWKENLILEKYYQPVLKLEEMGARKGMYRFSPTNLEQLEASRPRGDLYPYDSPAGRGVVWVRPGKGVLWVVTVLLVVVVLALTRGRAEVRSEE